MHLSSTDIMCSAKLWTSAAPRHHQQKHCYVACGRFDGMWELKLCAWDVAAGFVICKEAGVKITALDGESEAFKKPYYDYIIANPVLHTALKAELKTEFYVA